MIQEMEVKKIEMESRDLTDCWCGDGWSGEAPAPCRFEMAFLACGSGRFGIDRGLRIEQSTTLA